MRPDDDVDENEDEGGIDDFDDDDYQEFVDREFGEKGGTSISKIWRWTAIGLLILFAITAMLVG